MNRRKIENWVIFGLKLLPFLMLILFAVYIHRHAIDSSTVPDVNNKVVSNIKYLGAYSSTNFNLEKNIDYDNDFFSYDFYHDGFPYFSFDGNLSDSSFYNLYFRLPFDNFLLSTDSRTYSFTFTFKHNTTNDLININFDLDYNNIFGNYFETTYFNGLSFDEFGVDDYYFNDFNSFLNGDFSTVTIYAVFFPEYNNSLNLFDYSLVNIFSGTGSPFYFISDTSYTYQDFNNVNPINASFIYFNNFLDHNINLEIFNIQEFYDWTVNSWFNGNAPLFYKPVFLILIYELIIDLLILLYSFITFVIKFAEKWLNGIYNKEW